MCRLGCFTEDEQSSALANVPTDLATIKKSTIYGNVMGSFAVQGYGLDGLLRIKKMDIKKRIALYEKITRF
jgi:hypothetical protein